MFFLTAQTVEELKLLLQNCQRQKLGRAVLFHCNMIPNVSSLTQNSVFRSQCSGLVA